MCIQQQALMGGGRGGYALLLLDTLAKQANLHSFCLYWWRTVKFDHFTSVTPNNSLGYHWLICTKQSWHLTKVDTWTKLIPEQSWYLNKVDTWTKCTEYIFQYDNRLSFFINCCLDLEGVQNITKWILLNCCFLERLFFNTMWVQQQAFIKEGGGGYALLWLDTLAKRAN